MRSWETTSGSPSPHDEHRDHGVLEELHHVVVVDQPCSCEEEQFTGFEETPKARSRAVATDR